MDRAPNITKQYRELSPPEQEVAFFALAALQIATSQSLTREQQAKEQWHYIATHDDMTDALNRRGLREHLAESHPKAGILVDATNFKAINSKLGYARGDEVITDMYTVLKTSVREQDAIARIGGDEYVIVLGDDEASSKEASDNQRTHAPRTSQELIDTVSARIAIETKAFLDRNPDLIELNVDLAVGGIEWPSGMSVDEFVKHAETRMKEHKATQHERGQFRPDN